MAIDRRRFIGALTAAAGTAYVAGPGRGQLMALADALSDGDGYGALGSPDALGVRLPPGFSARLIGRSGEPVLATGHVWHGHPDGGACFPVPGAPGHVYVSNSEVGGGAGGVSAVRFDGRGEITSASTILSGSSRNCSGGSTPWGTWLSCEENGAVGQVWECDPLGDEPARLRPAMGSFNHEAAAVDEVGRQVFLTEDAPDGRLYRFRPNRWPDLSSGTLEAAVVTADRVTWQVVSSTAPDRSESTAPFRGGEGAVVVERSLLFATKGDRRIWEVDLEVSRLSVFHDCIARPETPLSHVDNLAVHPATGHLFVAEDGGNLELCMLVRSPEDPIVTAFVQFVGHDASEVAGPAFSPDGRFLYVSSQRGTDGRGVTVQISGPFVSFIESIDAGARATSRARRLGNQRSAGPS